MADMVRVFVSHHHSPEEDAFTRRLVDDLKAAGADVWVDDQGITSEDFVRKISEGLAGSQWLVLVMSPASVASPWVQREVNTALNEVTARRMLGVIPLLMLPTEERDILALWRPLHRYDATRGYEPARDGLLRALGLSAAPAAQPAIPPQATPTIPSAARYPVPARLGSLGYQGVNLTGSPAYIPPMITIPAGPFLMGSDKALDAQAIDDETPQYWVEMDTFQVAKYPVTVAEYALAVRAGAVREPRTWRPNAFLVERGWPDRETTWNSQLQHFDHPVVCVSWHDAAAYAAWLNSVSGQRGWRLPTEAEWEKAARWDAPRQHSHVYPWGDEFDRSRCNSWVSDRKATSPIGSYPASDKARSGASPYGVEEMAGNVSEWTSTLFKPYPYTVNDGREDQDSIEIRSNRGGSWGHDPRYLRAAYRLRNVPDNSDVSIGFRVALASPGSPS